MSTARKPSQLFFIALEYIFGFGFGYLGVFVLMNDRMDYNLIESAAISIALYFGSAAVGVGLVGFFHFKSIGQSGEFVTAMCWSITGLFLFGILYLVIEMVLGSVIPEGLDPILFFLVTLSGAVIGLNFIVKSKTNINPTSDQ